MDRPSAAWCCLCAGTPPGGRSAAAAPDFDATFTSTAASDYFDDGLTQSDNQAVIQPMLEFYYGAFYGSVWASNVDYGKGEDRRGGAGADRRRRSDARSVDLRSQRYLVPVPGRRREHAYTYLFGSATRDFGNGLSLGAGYGYYWYDDRGLQRTLGARPTTRSTAGCRSAARRATTSIMTAPATTISGSRAAWSCRCRTASRRRPTSATNTTSPTRRSPSYLWYDAGVTYALTDWASLDVRYYGNGLSKRRLSRSIRRRTAMARVVASLTVSQSLSSLRPPAEPEQPVQPERPLGVR